MESSIQSFSSAGASGFVFGILNGEGKVDRGRNKTLVRIAGGKRCTFHKAFDEIAEEEMESQLEVLIECGFKAVLTSGGASNAVEGKERLRKLVEAAKERIEIIVGGGVRSSNVDELRETGASWFHSSAVRDGGEDASGEEVKLLCSKLGI
jgi:copper homeostasis protein